VFFFLLFLFAAEHTADFKGAILDLDADDNGDDEADAVLDQCCATIDGAGVVADKAWPILTGHDGHGVAGMVDVHLGHLARHGRHHRLQRTAFPLGNTGRANMSEGSLVVPPTAIGIILAEDAGNLANGAHTLSLC